MKLLLPSILGASLLLGNERQQVTAFSALGKFGRKFRFGKHSMPGIIDEPPSAGTSTAKTNGASVIIPDKDLNNIFKQNEEWVQQKKDEDPDYFKDLASEHKPDYLWIGCADARVPANEIMGEDAGSVFVVRNVANLVVGTDFNLMSALQYAVNVLKVPHIIVCGHYDCGGVRASMVRRDHTPPLENWLRNIRDVYRLHRKELDRIKDPEARHRRLVELNVVEQCINLFKTGCIQRRRVETYQKDKPYTSPRVHACVFDPATGVMRRLKVDFRKYIDELHDIYDLYHVDDADSELPMPQAPEPVTAEENSMS